MPPALDLLLRDTSAAELLLPAALLWVHSFVLVASRFSGLFILAPGIGQKVVPVQVRVLITLGLAFLITPTLPRQAQTGFANWDVDQSGTIEQHELPEQLQESFARRYGNLDAYPKELFSRSCSDA